MATLSVYSGAPASSGDNTLIAAPGTGLRIVPVLIVMQGNTSTADTLLLYSGASSTGTKLATFLCQNQGDTFAVRNTFTGDNGQTFQMKLDANKALVLNKAQAVATNVTVWYYTESSG